MLPLRDRLCPDFERLLDGVDLQALEQHDGAVYGLTADLSIGYLNPAWFRFAEMNGGADVGERWGLGAPVLDALGGSLRPFFQRHFERCLREGVTWRHEYQCPSPTSYRQYHMDVAPVGGRRGLLVVHSLVVEAPHGYDQPVAEHSSDYLREDGIIVQCFHCRRVQRADGSKQWDFVPRFAAAIPENVTGSLCMPCFKQHYPEATFEPEAT